MTSEDFDNRISCVAYARVSTDDKGQDYRTQLKHIKEWADRKGFKVVKEFSEELSGMIEDRPKLMEAITYCRLHNIPVMVAYDTSRITRADNLLTYQKLLNPTKLLFSSMDIDLDSPAGKLMATFKSMSDNEENVIRSTKTKLGMEAKRKQGKHMGRPSTLEIIDDVDIMKLVESGKVITDHVVSAKGTEKKITRIVSKDTMLNYADKGIALTTVGIKIYNISATAIIRKTKEAGIYDEYMRRYNFVKFGTEVKS